MSEQPYDLRKISEEFKEIPGQYREMNVEIDPNAETSGVYRYIEVDGTVERPTREGPAVTLNNIKGFPNVRVNISTMASRKRVDHILHHDYKDLEHLLNKAVENPARPVKVSKDQVPVQEVVHLATDDDSDIRELIAAPTNTEYDARLHITAGLVYGLAPDKSTSDVTIHRMVLGNKDTIGIHIIPSGHHIGIFLSEYQRLNKPMLITTNIDLDPATLVGATFESPTTPLSYSKLWVAGALRDEPVQLVDSIAVDEVGITRFEFIIEGEAPPNETIQEDINTHTGHAMPELPSYSDSANPALNVIKVKAVTYRRNNPIVRITIGSSEKHVSIAGIPAEASTLNLVDEATSGKVPSVCNPSTGGGKLMTVIQTRRENPANEGIQHQAALLTLSSFKELKTTILANEDVDIFDTNDIMRTINTYLQAHRDIMSLEGVCNHLLDPSERPEYSPEHIRVREIPSRFILDGIVPSDMKDRLERAKLKEVPDWKKYLD